MVALLLIVGKPLAESRSVVAGVFMEPGLAQAKVDALTLPVLSQTPKSHQSGFDLVLDSCVFSTESPLFLRPCNFSEDDSVVQGRGAQRGHSSRSDAGMLPKPLSSIHSPAQSVWVIDSKHGGTSRPRLGPSQRGTDKDIFPACGCSPSQLPAVNIFPASVGVRLGFPKRFHHRASPLNPVYSEL